MEPNKRHQCSLSKKHDLKNIITGPTCFKSSKGRCIDFILKNKRHSLMKTQLLETGFSDHHYLIYTFRKTTYRKVPPKEFVYRNYKKWYEERFAFNLKRHFQSMPTVSYTNFETAFENALEANAAKRTKFFKGK